MNIGRIERVGTSGPQTVYGDPPTPAPSEPCVSLVVLDLNEFRSTEFPQREPLVVVLDGMEETCLFSARSINQIFAWRGTGKTMAALALAGCMATGGSYLDWRAKRAARVLYVEGETPDAQLQERANLLVGITQPGYFRLLTLDSQPDGIPSIATAVGRKAIEDVLADAEVLFLDSISTLGSFPTNEEEEWLELLAWLRRLRSKGLCIIFLHHAGKTGMQRGHSRSEDMLDVSIKLTAEEDEERDFLKFTLQYDKFRAERKGVRSLSVELHGAEWRWKLRSKEKLEMLEEYLGDHPSASARKIAKDLPELGTHVTVGKLMKQRKGC